MYSKQNSTNEYSSKKSLILMVSIMVKGNEIEFHHDIIDCNASL